MARKHSRAALIAGLAVGAGRLVAVPAEAATNYVTQPSVSGASNVTPESAVLSGVVDTGGDPGTAITAASSSSPFTFGGLAVTSSSILNGFPVGQGYYATVLFEADPLSDYRANGDQPGPDTVLAATVDVPVSAGLSSVHARIGGTQASAQQNGSSPLTPGTRYVYFIQEQTGVTNAATTVNEFSAGDLAAWAGGSGAMDANGWAGASSTAANNYGSWKAGTAGSAYAGDGGDPTLVPGQLINPDWQCVPNASPTANEATSGLAMPAVASLASNTNATWQAELAAGQVPNAPGSTALDGTALPDGIASVSASGSFAAASGPQPAEQGACLYYYDGNGSLYYVSPVGMFTTPKLGRIVVSRAAVHGRRLALRIANRSTLSASGSLQLKIDGRTVAAGRFHAAANGTGHAIFELTGRGVRAAARHTSAKLVLVSSSHDQPLARSSVKL